MAEAADGYVQLQSRELTAAINPQGGAELSVLRDAAGRDLLWNGDPNVWKGRAPILFPIVGTLVDGRYRLDDPGHESYSLSRHGFARDKRFATIAATATTALFRLSHDEATLRVYPFRFELDVGYELAAATLSITATVRNVGERTMPASLGFHPGFRWPLPYGQPRAAHWIEFAADEPAAVRRITAAGLLAPERHATPVAGRRLALDDALFRNDVLIFDELRSRSLTYGAAAGPQLEIGFPDVSYLGLWTKPEAGFICIEPWLGVTDPVGFAGNLHGKPGIFHVDPGGTRSLRMTIALREHGESRA